MWGGAGEEEKNVLCVGIISTGIYFCLIMALINPEKCRDNVQ
jgi:hypothetical protein